ncbi:MAG TPA: hypothetical protein VFU22_22180 [Roseiflexaceae bacterium]|nr:hypothetical protein [Roseiflexaceae bacterium]
MSLMQIATTLIVAFTIGGIAAGRGGVRLAFRAHLRVGVPITLLTLLVALLLV